ncbi:MAG: ATP-binding protein, partial [Candidatus Zixiibacteriota bacterium]
ATQWRADSLEQFNWYLLASMNSGLVTINADSKIVSINQAAAGMLDINTEDYIGKNYEELFEGNDSVLRMTADVLECMQPPSPQEIEFSTGSDESKVLGVSVSSIRDHKRQSIGAAVLMSDVTEVTRLRRELEAKNRLAALGEMAGGLAHQLRNSVGAINGYCHLLRKRFTKKGLETGSVEALAQEAAEAEKLIERFLQFARPLHPMIEQVHLDQLLADIVQGFRIRPETSRISISSDLPPQMVVEADPLLVRQALANIIENAVYAYDEKPGTIEISATTSADTVTIKIRDYACGIPPEDLEKIFTPFYSLRPSGTGLGLPLAEKIVDLHNGSLTVESRLGQGTAFTVVLPLKSRWSDKLSRLTSSVTAQS